MTTVDKLPTQWCKRRRCEIVDQGRSQCRRLEEVIMGVVNEEEERSDDEDKLCLALAEVALDDFNIDPAVFYEHVNVVDSLIISSSAKTSTITLRITFQASLPASTQTTFVTKIDLSFPHPTLSNVEIGIRSVKIKGKQEEQQQLVVDNKLSAELDSDSHVGDPSCHIDTRVHSGERLDEKNLSQFDNDKQNLSEFDDKGTKKRVRYYIHPGAYYAKLTQRFYKGCELDKEIQSYNHDLAKSDGFEVGYYPQMVAAGIRGTHIFKCYDRENMTLTTRALNHLGFYCRLAICVYNMEENTYFDNVKVLKAMTHCPAGPRYNMTFEASLPDNTTKIFQTRISTNIPLPYAKIEIVFVRVKASSPTD